MLSNDRPKIILIWGDELKTPTNAHKTGGTSEGNKLLVVPYEHFSDAFQLYNEVGGKNFITFDQDRYVSGSSDHYAVKDRQQLMMVPEHQARLCHFLWFEIEGEYYVLC